MRTSNRGGHVIYHPDEPMTLEQRAFQMWAVHPVDLDNLGFKTREDFFLAHLQAVDQNRTLPSIDFEEAVLQKLKAYPGISRELAESSVRTDMEGLKLLELVRKQRSNGNVS